MTFTEVVFEIGDPQEPLCKVTAGGHIVYGLLRVTESTRNGGGHRALVTLCGKQDDTPTFLRDLHSSPLHEDVEALSVSPDVAIVSVTLRPHDTAGRSAFLPVARFHEVFGRDAIIEPIIVRSGRARVRLLLPSGTDTQRALLGLRELQRATRWPEFRVIRVANLSAQDSIEALRRVLTPDQEDVLRLAVTLGYYDTPKRATLEVVAGHMDLSVSPVHKRLKAIECTLITSFVEPALVEKPDFRRKPRRGTSVPKPAPITDVALRIRPNAFHPLSSVGRIPGARALFQHIHSDRTAGEATALLMVLGPEDSTLKLASELDANPDVLHLEMVGRDRDHAVMKLKTTLPGEVPRGTHPYAWFKDTFRPDVLLKPAFVDGPDVFARFLLLRPTTQDELIGRIDSLAKRGGWDQHEILAVRPFGSNGHAPWPAPDRLTPRQEEVLKISYALGYYQTPRKCTLENVADTLGVSANAIHKNLAAAELNVITTYLSSGF